MNGGRSKLSAEQLAFVGCVSEPQVALVTSPISRSDTERWVPITVQTRVDEQLEALAARRDLAPNWLAFAKAIVGDEREKSK
jgi:hypothetical protein